MFFNLNYIDFKSLVNAKGLRWQYVEVIDYYTIFAIDGPVEYQTFIWKTGYEPEGTDIPSENSNRTDFETNYKPYANLRLDANNIVETTGSIVSASTAVVAAVSGSNGCTVSMSGTYAGVNIAFEISNDGGITYFSIAGSPIDASNSVATSSGVLSSQNKIWIFSYGVASHFRVRAFAYISGTANIRISQGNNLQPISLLVAGSVPEGSGDFGNPVKIAGVVATSNPAVKSNGARSAPMLDKAGRLVVIPFHIRDMVVNNMLTLTTTTETTLIAAGGSGVFNDISQVIVANNTAAANSVLFRDTTGGTVRFRMVLPANQSLVIPMTTPWKQTTANSNWTAQLSTAASTVYVSAQAMQNI